MGFVACVAAVRVGLLAALGSGMTEERNAESNTAPIPATIARVSESACSTTPFPFLGVARSVLGRAWVDRCEPTRAIAATAIAQTHGLPDVLARVLAGRGIGVRDAP